MQPKNHLSYKQMAILLAMLIAIMPFSIDAYLPSVNNIAQSLQVDIHHVEKSLSSFMFGVALGQIIGGSLSDIKGRRNIALFGLLVYLVGCLGLIFVETVYQLMGWRVVQALGAGMSSVVAGALVRDNYQGKEAAQMFALIGIILMTAPLLAPMLGSLLQDLGGWRAIFVFLLLYGGLVFTLLQKCLPKHNHAQTLTMHHIHDMAVRYKQVLQNKVALGFLAYQAGAFSSMMIFLTESPFVYMQRYEISPKQYAWLFGCNIAMMMICNRLTAFGLRRDWTSVRLLTVGISIQMCANILLTILVLSLRQPPLVLLVMCVMVSVGTQGLIVANTQSLFMSQYQPTSAGSANAILSAGQSLIGAAMAYLATLLHNGSIAVMARLMLASTTIGTLLLWQGSKGVLRKKA